MKLATRLDRIEPFYVMECAKAAAEIADSPACDPAQGGSPMIDKNPEDMASYIKSESAKWSPVIKALGLKADGRG